jgi:hypothetical protein
VKLLFENWREYLNEESSTYDIVVDRLMADFKKFQSYIDNNPWGLISILLDTLNRPQWSWRNGDEIAKLWGRGMKGKYRSSVEQVLEKIEEFIKAHEIVITQYDTIYPDTPDLVGRKGKIEDFYFHTRNRPIIYIDWGDQDEISQNLNRLGTFSRVKKGEWRGGNYVNDYEMKPVKSLTLDDLERLLKT